MFTKLIANYFKVQTKFNITWKGFTVMQTINKTIGCLVLLSLLSLVSSRASAQVTNVLFDEYGNGFVNGVSLPFSVTTEPLSSIATLRYVLPFMVRPGDLFLTEGVTNPPTYSDLIRFDNISTTAGNLTGAIYFFSDLPEPNEIPVPLADVGVPPPNAASNAIIVVEIGPEGSNGYVLHSQSRRSR